MSNITDTPPKLVVEGLYKIFGKHPQQALQWVKEGMNKQELLDQKHHVLGLQDINLSIQPRSIEVIMGLSGSGKSTLIRHFNRLLEPTAGKILLDGEDILTFNQRQLREMRLHKIAMVFQKFALMPHLTIAENVQYGLKLRGSSLKEADLQERCTYWLERVGLKGMEQHYPRQLSGGMQQRVGLARALATDADILLMDEAFSALDPLIRTDMQDMLLSLQQELNKTIIFITHDLDEALRIGDSIAILRDGALIQQGNAQDILLNPVDAYVRRFVADVNRTRVLKVKTIMQGMNALPTDIDDSRPMTVKGSRSVEYLLNKTILQNPSAIWVVNNKGERIGYIDRAILANTIGRDEEADQDWEGLWAASA
ncbi:quaternary amine ABC transporter ATP-binding protein [Thiofilum flexile]|uniref:quaternary amine ABC transporter ATP-binding protein n=1 Tax=Thiofilum flexile TaxID=125627 RepID=UPI00036166FA|nr:betaine/proline/choline family ABC transporter ATP-binding protein [Thiofilum flexile]